MNKMSPSVLESRHPFDHIMAGPYRLVSMSFPEDREAVQSQRKSEGLAYTTNHAGTCQHCGMAIQVFCFIEGSEGRFKVGSTCIEKAMQEPKIIDTVKKAKRDRDNQRRKERVRVQFLAARTWMNESKNELMSKPHPKGFDGLTLFDYLEWYFDCAGNAKVVQIAKQYGFDG